MPSLKPTLYAMNGCIGSGKTTRAKQIAIQKKAVLFSIDLHVKQLGQPISNAKEYEKYYFGVRDIIADLALQNLKLGTSVVFDFGGSVGHWEWLKSLAQSAKVEVEIHHLIAPIETRRDRVKKRNSELGTVFEFSDAEFDSMPKESATPPEEPGLKIITVNEDG